ncbi:hypothetical protein MNEG_3099 [Monoraphidium neglectum]|uniref:BTB domain-containing protein n=1 Tax=Monoraphidium neglectum TaxID=145388 RepID=A0A0D2MWL6_9CHLO|nr:hypothetical protein MNEG_3099 [Monoraphidium neglectum]KIZ04852.1 hypothetical protein MNEG_3099 [Monoraphidium neglectum]|eukprot:XP_013903871.1 hypothetical protein MNEG_3099 [Monoraphidium neglectum]
MEVARLWLDNLTAEVERSEQAPKQFEHTVEFNAAAGPFKLTTKSGKAAQDNDRYVQWFMYWAGKQADAPEGVRFSLSFAAFHTVNQAGLATRLRIAPPPDGVGPGGSLLGGPFCDVAVRAGGREWQAHRVVLAAASPVLLGMLGGEMLEAQAAAVGFKEADEQVVELLLRHIYGEAIEVPLELLPALYGLADQYQLQSSLAMEARLLLSTVSVQPAALVRLLPAVHRLCRGAFSASWCSQAGGALPQVPPSEFTEWPPAVFTEVISQAQLQPDVMSAAEAWVEGQGKRVAVKKDNWQRLLDVIDWGAATREQLLAVQQWDSSRGVPGLLPKLFQALDALYVKMREGKAQRSESSDG